MCFLPINTRGAIVDLATLPALVEGFSRSCAINNLQRLNLTGPSPESTKRSNTEEHIYHETSSYF